MTLLKFFKHFFHLTSYRDCRLQILISTKAMHTSNYTYTKFAVTISKTDRIFNQF